MKNFIKYPECITFIEEALEDPTATNGILVHCFYGVSRSATIVIAFLMNKYSIRYREAYERSVNIQRIVKQIYADFLISEPNVKGVWFNQITVSCIS